MASHYQVITSLLALAEIEEICSYYEPIAPDHAKFLYHELVTRIRGLRQLPYAYRVHQIRKNPELTIHLMVYPYIVYYRVSEKTLSVMILRILHGARRQPRRFR